MTIKYGQVVVVENVQFDTCDLKPSDNQAAAEISSWWRNWSENYPASVFLYWHWSVNFW